MHKTLRRVKSVPRSSSDMALDHFYLKITKVCVVLTIYINPKCTSPFVLSVTVTADFEVKPQLHVCHFACSAPLHYRFWAIRGGPFGVVNFLSFHQRPNISDGNISRAPHLTRVQLIQVQCFGRNSVTLL